MRVVRALVVATVVAVVAVSLTGCGFIAQKASEKVTEKAIEGATGNKVDINKDGVTVEGKDGGTATIGEDVKVPDDFPAEVPVYDGTVKAAFTGDKSWTVSIETADKPQDILDFYQKKLDEGGFAKVSSMTTGDGGLYSAKKGNRTVQVVATTGSGNESGKTQISLAVQDQ